MTLAMFLNDITKGANVIVDLVALKQHLLKITQLDELHIFAVDLSKNSVISISDLLIFKKTIIGNYLNKF